MNHGGVAAEFLDEQSLLVAARSMRALGYREMDSHTPFPIHGIDELLGLPRSRIDLAIFPAAIAGALFAFFLQGYCNAASYRLNVGGRPPFAVLAFIPITFETTVLFSSLAAFFGTLLLCRLPRLFHPLFDVPAFPRASIDRYWLVVSASDPLFDEELTPRQLLDASARSVARFDGQAP